MKNIFQGWERLASGTSIVLLLGGVLVAEHGGDLKLIGTGLAGLAILTTGAMLYKMEFEAPVSDSALMGHPIGTTNQTVKQITEGLVAEHLRKDPTSLLDIICALDDQQSAWYKTARVEQIVLALDADERTVSVSFSKSGRISLSQAHHQFHPGEWEEVFETSSDDSRPTGLRGHSHSTNATKYTCVDKT